MPGFVWLSTPCAPVQVFCAPKYPLSDGYFAIRKADPRKGAESRIMVLE